MFAAMLDVLCVGKCAHHESFSDFRSRTNPDSVFRMGYDDCRNMSQMECVIEDPQVPWRGNDRMAYHIWLLCNRIYLQPLWNSDTSVA